MVSVVLQSPARNPHSYSLLLKRWEAICKRSGLVMATFAQAGRYAVVWVRSQSNSGMPRLYVSAGIHGDEAAATEGLVEFFEENLKVIQELEVVVFPCLNPWGLVNNSRCDNRGRDLNRSYHAGSNIRQTRIHKRLIREKRFDAAIMLHEDYDGTGVYLYEVAGARPYWGERLIHAAAKHLPVEQRRVIDDHSKQRNGIVRRRIRPDLMQEHPEAFLLRFEHTRRVFTFETPSEFHIKDRVAAQKAVLLQLTNCLLQK